MKSFIEVQEVNNPYLCYVDFRAIVSVDETLHLITFHNRTTLQLTPDTFERVVEALRREERGLNGTEETD